MAVAFDAQSFQDATVIPAVSSLFTGFTHTPVATPRGVVVGIIQDVVETQFTYTITYGGVSVPIAPNNGFAQDIAGEKGAAYLHFLGSGIPTGAQAVAITASGGVDNRSAFCASITADADTQIVDSFKEEGDKTNPGNSVAFNLDIAGQKIAFGSLFSGLASPLDATINPSTGVTKLLGTGGTPGTDWGARCGLVAYQTVANIPPNMQVSFTAANDDVAFSAIAIQEVGPSLVVPAMRAR